MGPLNKQRFTLIIRRSLKNISRPIYFLTVQITSLMSCLQGIYYRFTSLRLNYSWAMISCSGMEVAQQNLTRLLSSERCWNISLVHFCFFVHCSAGPGVLIGCPRLCNYRVKIQVAVVFFLLSETPVKWGSLEEFCLNKQPVLSVCREQTLNHLFNWQLHHKCFTPKHLKRQCEAHDALTPTRSPNNLHSAE